MRPKVKTLTVFLGRETPIDRNDIDKIQQSVEDSENDSDDGPLLVTSDIIDDDGAGREKANDEPLAGPRRKSGRPLKRRSSALDEGYKANSDISERRVSEHVHKHQLQAERKNTTRTATEPANPASSSEISSKAPQKTRGHPATKLCKGSTKTPPSAGEETEWEVEKIVDYQVDKKGEGYLQGQVDGALKAYVEELRELELHYRQKRKVIEMVQSEGEEGQQGKNKARSQQKHKGQKNPRNNSDPGPRRSRRKAAET